MSNSNKICFVIMGYGLKTDYQSGITLDLDKTYKNIIKPTVEKSGYICVRSDEIKQTGVIDKNMYALLMHADLVVADISTYNPNAIYELGIRHAVKPFRTIVMKALSGQLMFDLNHNSMFQYKHLGEDIGYDEVSRSKKELLSIILEITSKDEIDSPLYTYIPNIAPPQLPKGIYDDVLKELAHKENHVFAIVEKAQNLMNDSLFTEARILWKKAHEIIPNEIYFLQQYALAVYKSMEPSEDTALTDALKIIDKLNPDKTNDPETLGLTGSICKRLWLINKDIEQLKRAIKYYKKGFTIREDHYTGGNYSLCLNMMAGMEEVTNRKIYFQEEAQNVRREIIEKLEKIIIEKNILDSQDNKWEYATLATCYFSIGDYENANKIEELFRNSTSVDWEIQTYEEGKQQILELIKEV